MQKVIGAKNVLITGAAKGIGNAVACAFAKTGANVCITYKNSVKQAEKLIEELNKNFPNQKFLAVKADLAKFADAQLVADSTLKQLGGIDVLVNNAGVAENKLFIDFSEQEIVKSIDNNLLTAVFMCRAVLPHMLAGGGKIINISSVWGCCGAAMEAVYSAAKSGLIGLSKALAKEYGSAGITVNCVAPGAVEGTDMLNCYTDEELQDIKQKTPARRLATVKDVADTVLFLADSGFISGQVITVDGGFTL